jgi:hypothetical protein
MANILYFVPEWFFNIDIALGVLFTLITGVVAGFAFKIYEITEERTFRLFGAAFSCLSLSYLIRILLNIYLTNVVENSRDVLLLLFGVTPISQIAIYVYVLLFVIGYMTLAYITVKVKSVKIYLMLAAVSILAILGSGNKAPTFYLMASIFLVFIVSNYLDSVRREKNRNQILILISMLLLLISNVGFMFIGNYQFYYGYIITETIELAAYALIAYTLIRVINHGQKKRPA